MHRLVHTQVGAAQHAAAKRAWHGPHLVKTSKHNPPRQGTIPPRSSYSWLLATQRAARCRPPSNAHDEEKPRALQVGARGSLSWLEYFCSVRIRLSPDRYAVKPPRSSVGRVSGPHVNSQLTDSLRGHTSFVAVYARNFCSGRFAAARDGVYARIIASKHDGQPAGQAAGKRFAGEEPVLWHQHGKDSA